jgi:type IV pilus assembly protein PilE
MIVIALVAIIGAIAVPAYQGYIRESRLGAMRMNMDTLRIAVEAYKLDDPTSSYKPSTATSYYYNVSGSTTVSSWYGWIPEGSNVYAYVVTPTPTTYRLCAGQTQASDTWVRCDKGVGSFSCAEGAKGSTPKTALEACQ